MRGDPSHIEVEAPAAGLREVAVGAAVLVEGELDRCARERPREAGFAYPLHREVDERGGGTGKVVPLALEAGVHALRLACWTACK